MDTELSRRPLERMTREPSTVGPGVGEGLVPLRALRSPRTRPRAHRRATTTHELGDLGGLFTTHGTTSGGGKRIRICIVDTLLQTGGAEWYATQIATMCNPGVFEFVVVTWRSEGSALAERLKEAGVTVISSTSWSRSTLEYDEWKEETLFDLLDRLKPDLLFFSSQYLFGELPSDRLAEFPVVARISNFHADELPKTDFSAADRVICCTPEQLTAVSHSHSDKATMIDTGVNTDLFAPPTFERKDDLKRSHGLEGKTVVLFVARLGDPLKRTPLFQDVVRSVRAVRSDVAFLVVGYFESHNNDAESAFRDFVDEHEVVWKQGLAPWEMPDAFQMSDILLSTSAPYEGLSNTVLQALASGVVPVVTQSAGMSELVEPGETGFLIREDDPRVIAKELTEAVDMDARTRLALAENGRRRIEDRFSLTQSVRAYQQTFMETYRRQPATVCVTDGHFGIGGAEWLVALLALNTDPAEIRFELVMHRERTPFVRWMQERGFATHEAPGGMSYTDWLDHGLADAFQTVRPDVVMPCTITTWPRHDPFYRLLIISQNASDAAVLTRDQYDQADYFLCVSNDVKESLSADHQWKMSVLHNSIDLNMFRPDAEARRKIREQLGIGAYAKVVLWSGRMHEARKRLDVLQGVIAAMEGDEAVHFLVLGYFRGDEGDRQGWVEFMRSHRNISWVEETWPWDAPEYYAAADVYLSTSAFKRSDFEGLSVATVQALATALPVVTTMSGGQQEVVEDGVNGRLVEPGDVEGLADSLRAVVHGDIADVEEMGRRGRHKALEEFDIRSHARVYTRIARLLKNNVGTALAADPELPAPEVSFRDEPEAGEAERRTAASFVTYTWPLLREAAEPGAADVVFELPVTRSDLGEAEASVAAGARLVVRDLGPDYSAPDADGYDAVSICAVLDYLEDAFPLWASAERRGPDLIMERR